MKFRYYIVDTIDDVVAGTDDVRVATEAHKGEFNLVIDTLHGHVLGQLPEIKEQTDYVFEPLAAPVAGVTGG